MNSIFVVIVITMSVVYSCGECYSISIVCIGVQSPPEKIQSHLKTVYDSILLLKLYTI